MNRNLFAIEAQVLFSHLPQVPEPAPDKTCEPSVEWVSACERLEEAGFLEEGPETLVTNHAGMDALIRFIGR